ncbi:MAG: hypothetical protein P0S94_01695 [Simkaniaceae bacterium]|nr:hypothetical protein [Simkaniaceae bacterium]
MTNPVGHRYTGAYGGPKSAFDHFMKNPRHFLDTLVFKYIATPYETKLAAERVSDYCHSVPDNLGAGAIKVLSDTVGKNPNTFTYVFAGGAIVACAFEPTRGLTGSLFILAGGSTIYGKLFGMIDRLEKTAEDLRSTNTALTSQVTVLTAINGELTQTTASLEEQVTLITSAKDQMCEKVVTMSAQIKAQEDIVKQMTEEVNAIRGTNTAAATNLSLLEASRKALQEMETEKTTLIQSITALLEKKEALLAEEQALHERRVEQTDEQLGRLADTAGRFEAASPPRRGQGRRQRGTGRQ